MSPKKETLSAQEGAELKNAEAWGALVQFGQPIFVISLVAIFTPWSYTYCKANEYDNLVQVMISVPLSLLAIASVINSKLTDPFLMFKNYLYYFLHGLIISFALYAAVPLYFVFLKLNEGWFRDVFTGNMLDPVFGFGLRMYIVGHSLQLFLGKYIYDLIYN